MFAKPAPALVVLGWLVACVSCASVEPAQALVPATPLRLQPERDRDRPVRIAARAFVPVSRMTWCALQVPGARIETVEVLDLDGNVLDPSELWKPLWPDPVEPRAPTVLRIVDAKSGEELTGVDFPTRIPYRLSLVEFGFDGWLLRDSSSPIDLRDLYLKPPQPRRLQLAVSAKGYEGQVIELDVEQGGVQTVELDREAPLRVVVTGVDPCLPQFLRVYDAAQNWPTAELPLTHDGWLEVEGLRPGPARLEIVNRTAAGLKVVAKAGVELHRDAKVKVTFALLPPEPSAEAESAGRARSSDDAALFRLMWEEAAPEEPLPKAILHLRCGTRVLQVPASFEPPEGLQLSALHGWLDALALEAATPGLYELRPPQIPGFRAPASVSFELQEGTELEYVIEYERAPE